MKTLQTHHQQSKALNRAFKFLKFYLVIYVVLYVLLIITLGYLKFTDPENLLAETGSFKAYWFYYFADCFRWIDKFAMTGIILQGGRYLYLLNKFLQDR